MLAIANPIARNALIGASAGGLYSTIQDVREGRTSSVTSVALRACGNAAFLSALVAGSTALGLTGTGAAIGFISGLSHVRNEDTIFKNITTIAYTTLLFTSIGFAGKSLGVGFGQLLGGEKLSPTVRSAFFGACAGGLAPTIELVRTGISRLDSYNIKVICVNSVGLAAVFSAFSALTTAYGVLGISLAFGASQIAFNLLISNSPPLELTSSPLFYYTCIATAATFVGWPAAGAITGVIIPRFRAFITMRQQLCESPIKPILMDASVGAIGAYALSILANTF